MAETSPTGKHLSQEADDLHPESPTRAQAKEFDDEQQESGVIATDGTSLPNAHPPPRTSSNTGVQVGEETPPPKPPRRMNPQHEAERTLIEAFPGMDMKVIRAVLVASGGQVEPAFNALLSMSDPDFHEEEEAPPPRPPRPTQPRSQMQQDEMYARQLAEHYQSSGQGYGSRPKNGAQMPRHRQQSQPGPDSGPSQPGEQKDHSFFDDELPEIQKNLKQGFLQTQTKVTKWISDFRKRIDGEEDEDEVVHGSGTGGGRQNFGSSQTEQLHGIRKQAEQNKSRRSADRTRYDADPQVLSDNFSELELRDEDTSPRKPNRPLANPDLFKPTPSAPRTGPVDEVDALTKQPISANRQPSPVAAGKLSKKWQPLTSVTQNPETEDNDPFSLGDSDDEKEAKLKDINPEDSERLKKAASETRTAKAQEESAVGKGDESKLSLEPAELTGTMGVRDKTTEDLLQGKT